MKVKKNKGKEISHIKWVVFITIAGFLLSIFMSFFSEQLLKNVGILVSFLILFIIVFIGIAFDIIGIAVAVAEEKPFHSMAAAKVKGAKQAIVLIKNASRVSNFCNDVVGDICGIISGASAAYIIIKLGVFYPDLNIVILSGTLSGFVAALTIGGKAAGKEIAMNFSKDIVAFIGRGLYFFKRQG